MTYPHAHTLLTIMEQHNWCWNLCNFVGASRPFLVTEDEDFIGYPCSTKEKLNEILFQLERDYDGPAKNYLLCFEGVPTPDQFTEVWQFSLAMENLSITWCDVTIRVKWQRQMTALIDEHYPGGLRQAMLDRPWEKPAIAGPQMQVIKRDKS